MDPSTWMALGGGGAGLLKGFTVDADKERRDRALAAETARYSPWTGMKVGPVKEASPFDALLQGAGSGFAQGQEYMGAEAARNKNLAEANAANQTATNNAIQAQYYHALMNQR